MGVRIICWIIFSLLHSGHSASENFVKPIFKGDFCTLTCFGQTHRLCEPQRKLPCDEYVPVIFDSAKQETFLAAHNALRSRAALRFNIASMRRVYWDDQLSTMAEYWLETCPPTSDSLDPCTYVEKDESHGDSSLIQQNMEIISTKYSFLPMFYDTQVLTKWYTEGWNAGEHVSQTNESLYFFNYDDRNRFKKMINPDIWRIGCAISLLNRSYAVACNYYADTNDDFNYEFGKPASLCPILFPRQSRAYNYLCAADRGTHIRLSNTLIAISLVGLSTFVFLN